MSPESVEEAQVGGSVDGTPSLADEKRGALASRLRTEAPSGLATGLFAESDTAMLLLDGWRRIIDANPAACLLFGAPPESLLGRRWDEFVDGGVRSRLERAWPHYLSGLGRGGTIGIRLLDETSKVVEFSVVPTLAEGRHLVALRPANGNTPAPSGRPTRAPAGGLSERQREVLTLLAGGDRDEDIANALGLSRDTVRTHIRNLKRKLGARTRAEAVALAVQNGELRL